MLRDTIIRCKEILPMLELWRLLGLETPRGFPKSFCSVFREDKEPSASVFQVGKLWFFKDHATGESFDEIGLIQRHSGCDKAQAIKDYHELAGVQIEPKRVKDHLKFKTPLGKIVATYDYENYLSGEWSLWHQTVRYEPKRFLQRRPGAPGMRAGGKEAKRDKITGKWWIWTLEGIEPVLYRLRSITENPEKIVVVCEGEKDADALASEEPGFSPTTVPMGAGKWRDSYTNQLYGRTVIVAGQRDPAGLGHTEMVASKLRSDSMVDDVTIVDWSELWPEAASDPSRKLDIYDLIAAQVA